MGKGVAARFAPVHWAVGLLGLVLAAGCNGPAPSTSPGPLRPEPGPGSPEPTGPHAAARKVFEANCTRCHSTVAESGTAAAGPMGRPRGPNLAKVGADPKHTRDWLIEHIRDPQAHNPESRMPKFGKLKEEEVQALADYLASLKGD